MQYNIIYDLSYSIFLYFSRFHNIIKSYYIILFEMHNIQLLHTKSNHLKIMKLIYIFLVRNTDYSTFPNLRLDP